MNDGFRVFADFVYFLLLSILKTTQSSVTVIQLNAAQGVLMDLLTFTTDSKGSYHSLSLSDYTL